MQNSHENMDHVLAQSECLMTLSDVQTIVRRIGEEVTQKLATKNIHVLSLMNGGLVFTGQLLPHLDFPMTLGYVHATRYRDQLEGSGLEWRVAADEQVKGRYVLLIDDIYDEGATLVEVKQKLIEQGATQVDCVVLLDKMHQRKLYPNFIPEFIGATIPDRYVFGFGLDYKGYWRNAPGIYALK
jgi:hypoxanthine phosphoribosyltransferase